MSIPLLEYLQGIRKLELNKYVCNKSISNLQNTINETQRKSDSISYVLPEKPELLTNNRNADLAPNKPIEPSTWGIGVWFGLYLLVGIIISVIYVMVSYIMNQPQEEYMAFLMPISVVISLIWLLIRNMVVKSKYKNAINEWNIQNKYMIQTSDQMLLDDYNRSLRKYNNECERITNNYNSEKEKLNSIILQCQSRISEIDLILSDINKSLEAVYSANIVFPKYRSLVPVTMFCEYLETGRCTELSGTNGAYNKYEEELLQNRIIDKLDRIHSSFEGIKQNQYLLYSSISNVNATIGQLSSHVQNQAALQAYNNQLLADKARAMESIEMDKLYELRRLNDSLKG